MKLRKRLAAVITGTVLMGGALAATGAADAQAAGSPPTLQFGAPTAALTLPAGCGANLNVHLKPVTDGSYRGFLSTRCGSTQKVFYVQRDPNGVWALRTTPYTTFNYIADVAVDSTGTYVLFDNSRDQLLLGKRQANGGGLITPKVLGTHFYAPRHGSLIADNGKFWAVWTDDLASTGHGTRDGLWETKTIGIPVTQGPVGRLYHDSGTLVQRADGSVQLATFDEIRENDPAQGFEGTGRITVSDRHGTGWSGGQKVLGDNIVTGAPTGYADFGGRLYAAADELCHPDTANDDTRRLQTATGQGSGFAVTELEPANGVTCAAAPTDSASTQSGHLLKLGSTVWVSNNALAWKADANGRFTADPTEQLAAQPAGTTVEALLYRSGHMVRVLSQQQGADTRIVEEISR